MPRMLFLRIINFISNKCDEFFAKLIRPDLIHVRMQGYKNICIPYLTSIGRYSRIKNANSGKGVVIEKKVWIGENVEIEASGGGKIQICEGASIQDRCKLFGSITIGRQAILSPNVYASSGTHFFSIEPHLPIREQDKIGKTLHPNYISEKHIEIGEDCWIGTNVFIKSGIYLGKGCIVGSNSVVSKDIAPYEIIAGAPAKPLKKRLSFEPRSVVDINDKTSSPYFYEGFRNDGMVLKNATIVLKKFTGNVNLQLKIFANKSTDLSVSSNIGLGGNLPLTKGSNNYKINMSRSDKRFEFTPNKLLDRFTCLNFSHNLESIIKILYAEVNLEPDNC
ncbi:MAG: DapH/DapD/GlmU-related protein [Bdellovibrionota bacterium]